MIPDDVISQIRDAADIVQVVGQYVQLKKAGRSWKGLCPFHGEKTPSFNVTPDKGFFMCFGCQKKGDVFTFLMELEGKSFVEAAEQLAQRYNIAIPRVEESPELRKMRGERVAMLELNKLATAFFREVLADPKRGEPGRAYLARRGVTQETSDRFQLGYAPADWGALADYLKAKRADLELAVKLGLLAPRPKSGGYYDRNRDRLVCPVVVPGGEVVGFSARVVGAGQKAPDGSEPPKYINSPESTVYKKSKLLFGLAQAREAMQQQKRAVLVEGNFDVITLSQAGFAEVVAPLGTALTPEQVALLKRFAERIVLLYDGDRAGYKATMHALEMCVAADLEVLVAARPGHKHSGGAGALADGMDPDSLVSSGGAAILQGAVDKAVDGIHFFAHEVWAKARGNLGARARALEDAARLASKLPTEMRRTLFVGTLATAMEMDQGAIRNALAQATSQARGNAHGPPMRAEDPRPPEAGAPPPPVGMPPLEEVEVMTLLCDHPSLIATAEADKAFWLLTDARLRDMYSAAREGQAVLDLVSKHLPPPAAKLVLSGKYVDKNAAVELAALTKNLDLRRAGVDQKSTLRTIVQSKQRPDAELTRLHAQLAVATRMGDRELMDRLKAEISNRKQDD